MHVCVTPVQDCMKERTNTDNNKGVKRDNVNSITTIRQTADTQEHTWFWEDFQVQSTWQQYGFSP